MFRPVKMQKVILLAAKAAESRLIAALHRLGAMEILSLEMEGLEKGKPLEIHDAVSKELVRVRALMNALAVLPFVKTEQEPHEIKGQEPGEIREPDYAAALKEAGKIKIDEELKDLVDARAQLISEAAETERKKAEISALSHFSDIDFSKLETKNFTFALGIVKKKMSNAFTKDAADYLKDEYEMLAVPLQKESELVLLFYPKKENISFLLSRYEFEKMQLPENFSTYKEGIAALESRLGETREKITAIERRLRDIADVHLPLLMWLEKELSVLSARAAISAKFASGRKVAVIEGWIKKKDAKALSHLLKAGFGGEAELLELREEEGAPIVLENPKMMGQFQWLVEFYSLPSYGEFDPTFMLMFTVPMIYGMILGDVGYGLISVGLCWLILKKYPGGMLGNVAKIWLFSSVSAMVFGIVFDEWFGFQHMHLLGWLKQWGINSGIEKPLYEGISRSHNLSLVIGLTMLVGIIQLSMGFILGALNAWHHDKKHAFTKIMWLALLISGSLAVSSLMLNLLPVEIGNIAGAVLALSAVSVIYLEGLPGLFEIPGLAANVLSYARIAAAGVVGVILAEIINESMLPTPQTFFLLPLFIILHILNAAFAMFESIVQGGRLNLVEFYSKFFHGGGRAFQPFRMGGFMAEK